MSNVTTMVQMTIEVGEHHFLLAQGLDVEDLKRRIEAAVHSGGAFVDFVVVGNRVVSLFFNGALPIALSVQTVPMDERDTGDTGAPFGGMYDIGPDGITES